MILDPKEFEGELDELLRHRDKLVCKEIDAAMEAPSAHWHKKQIRKHEAVKIFKKAKHAFVLRWSSDGWL